MTTITILPQPPRQARLIGIGGKLRSGKDTVADHLVDTHGWVKLGMSDPLDTALLAQNPWIQILPEEPLNKNKSPKYLKYSSIRDLVSYVEAKDISDVRRNLQTLGTEVGRNLLGPDTWVNVADDTIREYLTEGRSVILTGVRYPNEVALINKYDIGQTWYVVRPSKRKSAETDLHSSETSVSESDFSVIVNNNGTLKQLYSEVDRLLYAGLDQNK